jgi:PAS domain S-box-containing protein
MKAPFLQGVLDGMTESVKIIDDRYRIVYVNAVSRKTLGAELNDLRGRSCHQAFYGFQEKCFFCNMGRVFSEGRTLTSYCTMSVEGVNRDFEVSVYPLHGADGKVPYAVEVVKDITPLSKGAALQRSAGKISSRDPAFGQVFEQMSQWAEEESPIMLQGEKGTGKKSFARALHQRSRRTDGPFRVFHCVDTAPGECSEGLFGEGGAWEKTSGGTLYLDGICRLGDASQRMLASKLSAQAGPGEPRVVAATELDLLDLVHREVIRPDLYNRFASRVLRLPALRERKQDLPFLAQHFIETYKVLTGSPAEKLGPQALTQLMTYAWPGNIQEMETQIERACLMATGSSIERLEIPVEAPRSEKLGDLLEITEKAYLVDALAKARGGLTTAARSSGLSLKTFQRKMKKYGLKPEDFRNLPQ